MAGVKAAAYLPRNLREVSGTGKGLRIVDVLLILLFMPHTAPHIASRIVLVAAAFVFLAAAITSRPPKWLSDFDQSFYLTIAYGIHVAPAALPGLGRVASPFCALSEIVEYESALEPGPAEPDAPQGSMTRKCANHP